MNPRFRSITLWIVIFLVFIVVAQQLSRQEKAEELSLSELIAMGEEGREVVLVDGEEVVQSNNLILEVVDSQGPLKGTFRPRDEYGELILSESGDPDSPQFVEREFRCVYEVAGGQGRDILTWALENGIPYEIHPRNEFLTSFLPQILVMVVLLGILWLFLARQFQSGSSKAMSFGKSRAKLVTEGQVTISFEDVAGIDEVKEELREIIEFLKDPERFSRLGGKIPKGALLYGPPGTGKTLIARATAGEASVPFFSISGSDFVEMFVGVGASRVRDLFEQGKRAKPCLIYIDEIDSVGRTRFAGMGGGHDEREQTLNALLVELDGFAPNEGVIVMASTNRPDVLDPALLRPGRFDRQIRVDLPDVVGREKILALHTREIKMAEGVSLKNIAKGTPGFSGADLANLANEAALLAAREDKENVGGEDLEEAKDRVMMGPARRSLAMSEEERINTAYHESGHALVARLLDSKHHRVHKVTIIPRGRALGVTAVLPETDQHSQSRKQLTDMLLYMMGGRAAEEIKFSETTTGASNDLHRATEMAYRMICEFGMSEQLGPRTYGSPSQPVFLGRDITRERDFSEETSSLIDAEVQKLINDAYAQARTTLEEHRDDLECVSQALLDRETITGDELDALLRGETLPPVFRENGNGTPRENVPPEQPEEEAGDTEPDGPSPLLNPPTEQPS